MRMGLVKAYENGANYSILINDTVRKSKGEKRREMGGGGERWRREGGMEEGGRDEEGRVGGGGRGGGG